jgi:hypothetical protein
MKYIKIFENFLLNEIYDLKQKITSSNLEIAEKLMNYIEYYIETTYNINIFGGYGILILGYDVNNKEINLKIRLKNHPNNKKIIIKINIIHISYLL